MSGGSPLADQLRNVCVGLRSDLIVTRHLYRDEPSYVLQDPLTFESQRFEASDYELLLKIRPTLTLGLIFGQLVEERWLLPEDEEAFYQFVLELHRKRLLKLPIADDKLLLGRHQERLRQQRRALWMAPVFWKRRLMNPGPFLDRTYSIVAPLFTRPALIVWGVTMLLAMALVVLRWEELVAPLGQVLLTQNLALMWVALVGLKAVHELGHAYATKHFGGEVPEIGLNLIVLTPLPFVDASAAWSFPSKVQRIAVSLAGMYVELFIAAIALFVWASTEASLLNAFAYLVAFTGSVVTLLFNLNPLMKFDGYYVLADLIEMPNLRSRSTAYLRDLARRVVFGLPASSDEQGYGSRIFLAGFGIAGAVYKVTLVLSLSIGIATKFPAIGLGLAASYVLTELAKLLRGAWATLADVRGRGAGLGRVHGLAGSLFTFVILPLAVVGVPLPAWYRAPGVVEREQVVKVHAQVEGFLASLNLMPGMRIEAGETLLRIQEPAEEARLIEGQARLEAAELKVAAALTQVPGTFVSARAERDFAAEDLAWREGRAEQRAPVSPIDGVLLEVPEHGEVGRFVQLGETVARIAGGRVVVRAVLRDENLPGARIEPGEVVRFRPRAQPRASLEGTIQSVEPLAIEQLDGPFGRAMSEKIAVDPSTGVPLVPHYVVRVLLEDSALAERLPDGTGGRLLIQGQPEPLLARLTRSLVRFVDSLSR